MKSLTPIFICILLSPLNTLYSQTLTQTIRGTLIDKISQTPLPGANIVIINSSPMLGATTDVDGVFKLTKVPIGTHTIKISFMGYKEMILPAVIVNSGKEVVLNIPIEEDIVLMQEMVITATEKDKPINDMAEVSARTFSVEETRKFAAAVNDRARMATSFAGVVQTDDGNSEISIGGNSTNRLLWRMEGVDIPHPNHFSNAGKSIARNQTEYIEYLAFSEQLPSYFRTDLRVSMKRNRKYSTHTLALDIQNASNNKNIYGRFFDANAGKVKTYYQTPLIPLISYKIEF